MNKPFHDALVTLLYISLLVGLSLSMKWPAQISDEGVPQEKSLYVSDDDIIAFSERYENLSFIWCIVILFLIVL